MSEPYPHRFQQFSIMSAAEHISGGFSFSTAYLNAQKTLFHDAFDPNALSAFYKKMKDLNHSTSFYEGNVAKECEKLTKTARLSFTSYAQVTHL